MDSVVKEFLQYGATGILALAFLLLLFLYWKKDKRSDVYLKHVEGLIQELRQTHVNENLLVEVVKENTRASTQAAEQLRQLLVTHTRTLEVLTRLNSSIRTWKCPFAANEEVDNGSS